MPKDSGSEEDKEPISVEEKPTKKVVLEPRKNWGRPVEGPTLFWNDMGEKVVRSVFVVKRKGLTITITESKTYQKDGRIRSNIKQERHELFHSYPQKSCSVVCERN